MLEDLKKIAWQQTKKRFCSCCGIILNTTRCYKCYSDDLMLYNSNIGPTWDIEDIVENLIQEFEICKIEQEELFEEFLNECYPTYKMGYCEFDASRILKNCSPYDYKIWLNEHFTDNESYFEFKNNVYPTYKIQKFIDENLIEEEEKEEENERIEETSDIVQ